jgi:predicted ATP-binding protein involved in virulence
VFLPPQNVYETPSKNILVIDKNKVTFEVETNLSEGEKMLIQLIADISRRLTLANPSLENPLEGTGIILIDEIELHLHPKWQRNILPALTKTFPNIQFIVTTHSPQVLSNVPNGSVFAIEDGKVHPVNSFGQDSNSLLWKNFNITEHPKFTSDLIADCAKLIENEQFKAAQNKLAELTQILGNDDSNVIELKTELDFYLQESE